MDVYRNIMRDSVPHMGSAFPSVVVSAIRIANFFEEIYRRVGTHAHGVKMMTGLIEMFNFL